MKKLLVFATCITMLTIGYTNIIVYATSIEQNVAGISTILDKVDPIGIKQQLDIKYQYTTDRVNLRKEASTNSDKLITLDKRTKVQMITSSDNWMKVKYEDKIGYIKSEYLRDTELPSLELTDEEIDLLAKIVWLEARGESDEGEAAVVIIVKNRILSTEFSDTMLEVLSDNGEFSTWKLLNTAKPTEREYEIIEEVMNGLWDELLTEDYVYFSTSPRNNHGTIKIGAHYFCTY